MKGKIETTNDGVSVTEVENQNELYEVLIGLGYKDKEIKAVIGKVDNSLTIEEQIKEALRLFLK